MSKQTINVGATANDNQGSTLRAGGQIINANFDELYTAIGNGSSTQLSVSSPYVGQVLKFTGTQFEPARLRNVTSSFRR